MGQDMRGNIAAGALLLGVATAVVASAWSEMGTFPLDKQEQKVAERPSTSPSATPSKSKVQGESIPRPSSSPVSRSHVRTFLERKPIIESPKSYAKSQVGSKQFSCLNNLWIKESHWDETATNSSSGAYGIPQALPGSKMANAGKDWKTNPITQVKWGLDYIDDRYDSACNAWQHWLDNGWY